MTSFNLKEKDRTLLCFSSFIVTHTFTTENQIIPLSIINLHIYE